MSALGQYLKQRRNDLGFTLRDVERITNGRVSNPLLSQIESGRVANPSARTLSMLSAVYALDGGDLLRRAGDPSAPPQPIICPTCGKAQTLAPATGGGE